MVYLHCWGRVGRTGTAATCRLIEVAAQAGDPIDGGEAIERLSTLRGPTTRAKRLSPERAAQATFVREWAE